MTQLSINLQNLYNKNLTSINKGSIAHRTSFNKKFTVQTTSRVTDMYIHDNTQCSQFMNLQKLMMQHSEISKDFYIVHCHPQNILAFTGLEDHNELKSIKNLFPELSYNIGINVPYYSSSDERFSEVIYKRMKHCDIVALENHGIIAKGQNLENIIDMIESLDYYCETAIKASFHNCCYVDIV